MIGMIGRALFRLYQLLGKCYLTPMLLLEWKRPLYKFINERPVEYGFAFKWLSRICPEDVLDVGTGTTAWPHIMANCGFRVTAIDKIRDYWKGCFLNRHYYVINEDITNPEIEKQFDLVTCISVLEHIPNHRDAVKAMFGLLKPGGHLLLTFPYNEGRYVDNVYALPGAGYGRDARGICQVFSRNEVDAWLNENPGTIVDQEYYEIFSGDLWTFNERIYPPRKAERGGKCHLTCILIRRI
jgi:SAM-dependent methyltransferase